LGLEGKVKGLVEGEEVNEGKIFDEIEVIKTMMKNQSPTGRKKSGTSLGEKEHIKEEEEEDDEEENKNESEEEGEDDQEEEPDDGN
jgi:hypothetical protein